MSFLDKMKMKAEELELDKKAKDLQEAVTVAAKQARVKAGDFTAENREKIDGYVDKAASTVDTKTEGKYADKVAKVKQQVVKGVDKVAEGSPGSPGSPGGVPRPGGAGAAGSASVPGSPSAEANPSSVPTFPVDPEAPQPPASGAPGGNPPPAPGS